MVINKKRFHHKIKNRVPVSVHALLGIFFCTENYSQSEIFLGSAGTFLDVFSFGGKSTRSPLAGTFQHKKKQRSRQGTFRVLADIFSRRSCHRKVPDRPSPGLSIIKKNTFTPRDFPKSKLAKLPSSTSLESTRSPRDFPTTKKKIHADGTFWLQVGTIPVIHTMANNR
ncbi:b41 [miniopterid betaherpesvirus 1]|uniref:B41 n=1 Tax=miniopterid betaherpesvirus 1 TaxID=3070189 RepID=I3VQ22_9BETA|nr:b41 [miniopterid betaherpesvirus 1]AFK83866.1 b41 [miniopterid betaherpesvirus 1]